MKNLLVAIPLVVGLCGGCAENDNQNSKSSYRSVSFSSRIASTRAYENFWEGGDCIGVYMVADGATDWLTQGLAANRKYAADLASDEIASSVIFNAADAQNNIVWPSNGSVVDFVAYYPWSEQCTDCGKLSVDVTSGGELMWSNNARGLTVDDSTPGLSFEHVLTRLRFNIRDTDGRSLSGMSASLEGLPTTATFDLSSGKIADTDNVEAISATVVVDSDDPSAAVITAVVIPGSGFEYQLTMTMADGSTATFAPAAPTDFVAGKRHIYTIELAGEKRAVVTQLSSITPWDELKDDSVYQVETSKSNDSQSGNSGDSGSSSDGGSGSSGDAGGSGGSGGSGPRYSSGIPTALASGYTIEGNYEYISSGVKIAGGQAVLVMNTYSGAVASVAIEVAGNVMISRDGGRIESVTVGETALLCGGATSTDAKKAGTYIFTAPSGEAPRGEIKIVLAVNGTNYFTITGFTIN